MNPSLESDAEPAACCDAISLVDTWGVSMMELIAHGEHAVVITQLSPRRGEPYQHRLAVFEGPRRATVTLPGNLTDPDVLAPAGVLLAAVPAELRARMHGVIFGRRPPREPHARVFLDAERAIAWSCPPRTPAGEGAAERGRRLYELCLAACECARGDLELCAVACAAYLSLPS